MLVLNLQLFLKGYKMNILIVDDEKSIRFSLVMSIEKLDVKVFEASNGEDAIKIFRKNKIDIVFLDIKMPGMDGIEVLKLFKQLNDKSVVIMMTHLSEVRLAVQAMKLGAHDYFSKPFSVEEMVSIVKDLKIYLEERESVKEASDSDSKIIGQSKYIIKIQKQIDQLSKIKYNTSILITGESGTGKELIAKLIHSKCAPNKPYVAINCAAIPKSLQESELFGHEKGSFSDAKHMRIGLIESSKDGILFLDEIGDMDLDLQAKLLRVLQEKKFRRIGGNKEIEFNAMVVAATNKKLDHEIQQKKFRKDLYYRLNIIPIKLPALRERREDIEVLAEYFINYYDKLFDKSGTTISDELMNYFKKYDWPGNIREMKNIIERLMILNIGDRLHSDELPYELLNEDMIKNWDLGELEFAEHEVVLRALSKSNWNITKAAASLNISRLTLRRKIEKYGLVE